MKKIVIAEDHLLYRETLKQLLTGYEIVGETDHGSKVSSLLEKTKPDLLILDLSLPNVSGIAIAKQIKQTHPDVMILVLTIHMTEDYVQEALKAGVDGYCLKDEDSGRILSAIERVLDKKNYISPTLVN